MKLLLTLLLTLTLTACSGAPTVKQEPPPAEPEAEEMIVPEETEEIIRYEVEIVHYEDTRQAEDGTTLLTYAVHIPELVAYREDGSPVLPTDAGMTPAEEQALAVTAAFHETFEEWTTEASISNLLRSAEEDFAWCREEGFDWHGGYVWELSCGVYQTERMLSVSGLYYSYTGGAHPNTYQLSWNFDLEEGVFFEPEILGDGAGLRSAVAEEIIRQAQMPREDGSIPVEEYWEDYETLIADWSSHAVSFHETGMTVLFSPYALAPYVAGPQEFHFPYDWLEPYLGSYGRKLLGLESV